MLKIEIPPIVFSPWTAWNKRVTIIGGNDPGVYLLARFARPNSVPRGNANPLTEKIVYIGETCSYLRGRWHAFGYSAFQGKSGHSGGHNYNATFGDQGESLYVAAFPVTIIDENVSSAFIRYVERKLIWDYTERWGSLPACNKK